MQYKQETKRVNDAPELTTPSQAAATGPACEQDAIAYCQKEASLMALLRSAPELVEPLKIIDAVRKTRLCMIAHADVLSIDCMNTLEADDVTKASTASESSPSKKVAALDNIGLDDDSSMEINIYYSRHHNGAGHALRSGSSALAANHVQSEGSMSNLAEVLAHPLTWAFVLPFFGIGVYVCFTRLATFVRRRREERRIESKLYMPVN
ncbi:unnamed protein product [Peronospora farinosa]|uniref:Uncharacterized protein n=1 Tax=Peronospora farinosa TaxID=134698 RepID=A0AAV0SSS1_9STRA|nr:unnamed protein product [Peronospora farinosa]CAI5707576.1 unnamed protein product [Peronospora farinosa]